MAKDSTAHVNHNGGYNIKVREVENGFTIHYTELPEGEGEKEHHTNYIAADEDAVEDRIKNLHREWTDARRG